MFAQAFAPGQGERLPRKADILTLLITLITTVTLAAGMLFRFPPDFRTGVCIIVSAAAIALIVRSLFIGKLVWILHFFGVLGVFMLFLSDSVFPVSRLHARHGDAGALSGLAHRPWKIYQSVAA